MTLLDLTSREAVLEAIREYDQRGRDAFLERYGYRQASDYFLQYEGRRYDSKAIAGVAFGKQYPEKGPMKASEFSGGAETVKPKLEGLGFEVVRARDVPVRFGAEEILTQRAAEYRARVPELESKGYTLSANMDLKTDSWRAKNYEPSTIAYVAMDTAALPGDAELQRLLEPLLAAYERLVKPADAGIRSPPRPPVNEPMPYSIDDALKGLFMQRAEFERILARWRSRKNLVLQGAPGVGKSFVARRLAYALLGEKDEVRLETVQFHQAYGYEDFVQGYRPLKEGGFKLQDGLFLRFCKTAQSDPHRPYAVIVDEINRGNLSKILGEFMLLIEHDKRDAVWATRLAYADDEAPRFYVPSNVYLMGMMNTADRSLSMVDYALRRRFSFITLWPAFANPAFRAHLIEQGVEEDVVDRVIARTAELNEAISEDKANLGPGYQVGHSFFVPDEKIEDAEGWYERVIETEIRPLLEEYWFDDPEKASGRVRRMLERA